MSETSRNLARQIFTEALAATTVEAACARALRVEAAVLHAGGRRYDLRSFREIQIVSIGKAGATLFDAVRRRLPDDLNIRSIISAPAPPARLTSADAYFRGGHPVPNAASLAAAAAALDLLRSAGETTLVLFLISGGASAMFEQPLSPALTLPGLIELNRQLVASGATIQQINSIRKRLSAVKGGRLACAAPSATKLSLLISDVPADALDSLASGPTLPDTTADAAAASRPLPVQKPSSDRGPAANFSQFLEEPPSADHPAFRNSHHLVLLDNATLLDAAAASARRLGFAVVVDNTCDDWDYQRAAAFLIQRAGALAAGPGNAANPNVCLLSGGEVTVELPSIAGVGGRNQQLALFAASILPSQRDLTLLSAGSDGIDGNSPAAGAVVDQTTFRRAARLGLDPAEHLAHFNAFPLFDALGDALLTGPSGNNLRDLRILLTRGAASSSA